MSYHPLRVGTRVRHCGQQWSVNGPGTATIVAVKGPYPSGSYEYEILAGVEFSRATGPDNPETRRTWWSSTVTLSVKEAV